MDVTYYKQNEEQMPPGFRFHPTDEELITYYLVKKVLDHNFNGRAIAQVDLNKCEPWDLPKKAKMGEKEWYFYNLRDRKYPTGLRTNRATEAGYWKATGKDREIYSTKSDCFVGMKKTLVFYRGRAPKGEKTNWVIHEFRLEGKLAYHFLSSSSKDEWVISRLFQKSGAAAAIGDGNKGLTSGINVYPEMSSHASPMSLPPLLDLSPYASATAGGTTDGENYSSHDGIVRKEHVPCFSKSAAMPSSIFNHHYLLDGLTPLPPRATFNVAMVDPTSSFYHSLQDNLQLPFFFPPPGEYLPPVHGGGAGTGGNYLCEVAGLNLEAPETDKPGPTELDPIWSF